MTSANIGSPPLAAAPTGFSLRRLRANRWLRNARILIGSAVLVVVLVFGVFGQQIAPQGAEEVNFSAVLESPSLAHPLGTDQVGRDVLSRAIAGARVAVQVSVVSLVVAIGVGVSVGALSGYLGGWFDRVVMTVVDAVMAFPALILIMALTAVLGVSLTNAMIAIGIAAMPTFARVARSAVLVVRAQDYVLAANVIGLTQWRLLLRHILPNIIAPLIVVASLQVGQAILAEAGLSYLGLGAQPPTASWGFSINQGRAYLAEAPWVVFGPGFFLLATVFAVNLLGDGIRDVTDPRLRGR